MAQYAEHRCCEGAVAGSAACRRGSCRRAVLHTLGFSRQHAEYTFTVQVEQHAVPRPAGNCSAEIKKYCKGTKAGEGRLADCISGELRSNDADDKEQSAHFLVVWLPV